MNKKRYTTIHQNILRWYKEHGRVTLPWRNTTSAYEIYLSEIMLQQTQVKTVLERFYFQFLKRFPTFKDVASAPIDDILKAWEGLGYYTRARNLHKTAQITQGILPSSAEELEKLAGVGRSTAHAVACFAFHESLPILDANVKRILYRFFAIERCTTKELWSYAYKLFDPNNAYIYNQTMMDIGALICTHKHPNCSLCPFELECQGKNNPLQYPEKKVKKIKPIRQRYMVIYHHHNRYALSQNKSKLLGGLWGFEQYETFNINSKNITHLGVFTHHYTHFRLDANLLLISKKSDDKSYFTIEEIEALALSGADRKALSILKEYLK
jgi:A/G-specific adenine glycosylase